MWGLKKYLQHLLKLLTWSSLVGTPSWYVPFSSSSDCSFSSLDCFASESGSLQYSASTSISNNTRWGKEWNGERISPAPSSVVHYEGSGLNARGDCLKKSLHIPYNLSLDHTSDGRTLKHNQPLENLLVKLPSQIIGVQVLDSIIL